MRENRAIGAAKALLGKFEPYADIPWFWSDQYDVNLQILGDIPPMRSSRYAAICRASAQRFHLEDGAIRGVIAINTPARTEALAQAWMNQGRTIDRATLTDASTALA